MLVESLSYFPYSLTPKRRANRFEQKQRKGFILRYEQNGFIGHSDYFAWEELGDRSVDEVLKDLNSNTNSIEVKRLIDQAILFSKINVKHLLDFEFMNHVLYANEKLENKTIKLKVGINPPSEIRTIKELIQNNNILRIDANCAFELHEMKAFLNQLSSFEKSKIEYIEDPVLYSTDEWKELKSYGVSLALDNVRDWSLIDNQAFDYLVFKPNVNDFNNQLNFSKKVIFSSYMGHDVGRIYCLEMLRQFGDVALIHGIDTPNIYEEQLSLFNINHDKISLNEGVFQNLMEELTRIKWIQIYHKS